MKLELDNARLPQENHVYRSIKHGDIEGITGDPSLELTGKKLKAKYEKLNSIWLRKRWFTAFPGDAHRTPIDIPHSASFK